MIAVIARTHYGWAAIGAHNELVGTFMNPNLYEACRWFGVRRVMFGSYTTPDGVKLEAWSVCPMLDQHSPG